MYWFKYFIPSFENPVDWAKLDNAIYKLAKLGVEYQDFGRRGRCYRIPVHVAVFNDVQECLDETWKGEYPLKTIPLCLQVPWTKIDKDPLLTTRQIFNNMQAEYKSNGSYTDPEGLIWNNSDGLINYFEANKSSMQ